MKLKFISVINVIFEQRTEETEEDPASSAKCALDGGGFWGREIKIWGASPLQTE